jgi:hypothetical protein
VWAARQSGSAVRTDPFSWSPCFEVMDLDAILARRSALMETGLRISPLPCPS